MAEIIIDQKVRHGKPIIKGTRMSVDDVMGMLEAGMTYEEIEKDYGLTREQVRAVVKYVNSFMHGVEVHKVSENEAFS